MQILRHVRMREIIHHVLVVESELTAEFQPYPPPPRLLKRIETFQVTVWSQVLQDSIQQSICSGRFMYIRFLNFIFTFYFPHVISFTSFLFPVFNRNTISLTSMDLVIKVISFFAILRYISSHVSLYRMRIILN